MLEGRSLFDGCPKKKKKGIVFAQKSGHHEKTKSVQKLLIVTTSSVVAYSFFLFERPLPKMLEVFYKKEATKKERSEERGRESVFTSMECMNSRASNSPAPLPLPRSHHLRVF
eukprot:TRINITY_DN3709_c4_g1_i1.p1 TRINITY_DN3709_c4_g1~~TRINITY_DN3709_c4_g1_i1.p1  ORF type:complete len:113 (-),score=7.60 TRINITY_DN3709_c4_g1_i1:91-429(-)